jgi:Yip1 domain
LAALDWVLAQLVAREPNPMTAERTTGRNFNPWFSIWRRPRATIQWIVDTNPRRLVVWLAALSGFGEALDRASVKNLGDVMSVSVIIVAAAIIGAITGVVGLYVGSVLLRWTGRWIGGESSTRNIRAAMAWSAVPTIWAMLLWIPKLLLSGPELFSSFTPRLDTSLSLLLTYLLFTALELTAAVWTLIVFLKCLGQVQGFSAWKALGNAALATLVVAVPVVLIVGGLVVWSQ